MARKLRSKNGQRDSRNRAPPSKEANSIEIVVPPRRRQIRVLLGLFQQLVEFLFAPCGKSPRLRLCLFWRAIPRFGSSTASSSPLTLWEAVNPGGREPDRKSVV